MKLRIARKIIMAVTDDETGKTTGRHNENQMQRANRRWDKCKSAKADTKLMLTICKAAFLKRQNEAMLAKLFKPPSYGLIAAMAV